MEAAGLTIGGSLLSSFMAVAFERSSKTREFIEFFQGKDVINWDEDIWDRLEITLDTISVVLEDAEDKQVKSPAVEKWLNNLKKSVNHADDLRAELTTELSRLKQDYEFQQKQIEGDLKSSLKPEFVEKLMPKLEKVTARLEYFVSQIPALGLQKLDPKEKNTIGAPSSYVVDKSKDELNKFAILKPHTNTKELTIKGYKGTRFPDWLGDSAFSKMKSLTLQDCENCLSLPPLGQLTALKRLEIRRMNGISEIGKELYGDATTSNSFQALEELVISDCNISCFPKEGLAAPNLKEFEVSYCQEICSLPARMHTQLPLLRKLVINECPQIDCFPEGGLPSSLETLKIFGCKYMESLPAMHTQLPLLRKLEIRRCPEIECFPEGG